MSHLLVRGAALAAAASLLAAGSAAAAGPAQRFSSMRSYDASSDGRYALMYDGSVYDRRTSSPALPGPNDDTLTPVDLAEDAPVALYTGPWDAPVLFVRSPEAELRTIASVAPDGSLLTADKGVLVKHGTALVFSTNESTPRIIERNLVTSTSTVRLTGARLLDASEDGQVITFARSLAGGDRPAGTLPLNGDNRAPAAVGVGYKVGDAPARLVDVTHGVQVRSGNPSLEIPEATYWTATVPAGLQVSQKGGSYSFILQTAGTDGRYPYTSGSFSRLTADGSTPLEGYNSQISFVEVTSDPRSGAYTAVSTTHASGGTYNRATLVDGSGRRIELSSGSEGPTSFDHVVPTNAGSGAVFTAFNRDQFGLSGAWGIDELGAPGVDATPWLTLPRSVDAIDAPSARADVKYLELPDTREPVAGAFADYAKLTVKTTGNSAASVVFTAAPAGKIAAKSASANLTFLGFQLWSRTLTKPGTINLPAIPAFIPWLGTTVKVTLTSGTVLTQSAALSRTR